MKRHTPFQKYLLEQVQRNPLELGAGDKLGKELFGPKPTLTPPDVVIPDWDEDGDGIPDDITATANDIAQGVIDMLMDLFNMLPGGWPEGWDAGTMEDFLNALMQSADVEGNEQIYSLILQLLAGMGSEGIQGGGDFPDEWVQENINPVELLMLFYQILGHAWTYAESENWNWLANHIAEFRVWLEIMYNRQGLGADGLGWILPDWYWDVWGDGVVPQDIP